MVLKDYKKLQGYSDWTNKKTKIGVGVYRDFSGNYKVYTQKPFTNPSYIKTFKKKSQALKFAKAYMRKH